MNLLGCLDTPTSGDYYFKQTCEKSMTETELAHQRNESVGFVQSFNLLFVALHSRKRNAAFGIRFCALDERQTKKRAREALQRVRC